MGFPEIGGKLSLEGLSEFLGGINQATTAMTGVGNVNVPPVVIPPPQIPPFGERVAAQFATAGRAMESFGAGMSGLGANLAALTAPLALAGIGAIKMAADFEQSEIAFGTMLGSAEAGKEFLGELFDFAAKTPFEFGGVKSGAQSLLAMGVAADDIPDRLKKIGDVAAGTSQPIEEIALAYGKVISTGRLQGDDLNSFAERGVPLVAALAKQYGVTTGEVKKIVEQGKIGIHEFEAAFASLSDNGGAFADMMEAQSQSLSGLWATLSDTVGMTLAEIGGQLIETLDIKTVVGNATAAIQDLSARFIAFAKANPGIVKIGAAIAAIAIAAGPVLIAVGGIVSAIGSAVATIAPLAGAVAGLALPIAAVVAAAGLLYIAWQNNFGGIRDIVGGVVASVGAAADAIGAYFAAVIGDGDYLNDNLSAIPSFLQPVSQAIGQVIVFISELQSQLSQGVGFADALSAALLAIGVPEQLSQQIATVVESVQGLFAAIIGGDQAGASDALGNLFAALGVGADDIAVLQSAFFGLWDAITFGIAFVQGVVSSGLAAIQSFWAAHGDTILATVSALWSGLLSAIGGALSGIGSAIVVGLATIQSFWAAHGDTILATVSALWSGLSSAISVAIAFVQGVVSSGLAAIQSFWAVHGAEITAIVGDLWGRVTGIIMAGAALIGTIVSGGLAIIAAFWAAHGSAIMATINGIWDFVKSAFSLAATTISITISTTLSAISVLWQTHGDTVMMIIQSAMDIIHTIFETTTSAIYAIINAVIAAINGDWTAFGASMRAATDALWAGLKSIFDSGKSALVAIINQLWSDAVAAVNAAKSAVAAAARGVADALKSAFNADWGGIGREIVDGIAGGIASGVGAVVTAARDAAKAAYDAARGFLQSRSPSRLFHFSVGATIPQGLAGGISDNIDIVRTAAFDMARVAYDTAVSFPAPVIAPVQTPSVYAVNTQGGNTVDNTRSVTINNTFGSDVSGAGEIAWRIRQSAMQLQNGGVL